MVYSDYLCYMDKDKLINGYKDGKAISVLARDHDVARTTVIRYLKAAGVYGNATPVASSDKSVAQNATVGAKNATVYPQNATPPIKKKPSDTFALDSDWKKAPYCAIDEIVEVDLDMMEGGYVRLARNLHANRDGYLIRHYHNGEMLTEKYKTAEAIHAKYDSMLEGRVPVRHPWMV